jgi:DNA-binding NarL/FixJ family response regulator
MIRVFLIDDHPLVLEGVRALLAGSPDLTVAGSATSAAAALAWLSANDADVVLLDVNLPDLNGIELCQKIKQAWPAVRVLGLSTFKERSYVTKMIEQGASGYLLKNAAREEIEDAIRAAHQGRMYLNMEIASLIVAPAAADKSQRAPVLTAREKEVLALIGEGFTNQEIAEKLFISTLTVDSHRKNLLAKFSAKNTAALIKTAMDFQLL